MTEYKYIVEIDDHFSKWLWCYPIVNKEAKTVLLQLEKYSTAFGFPKILQCDNGWEIVDGDVNLFMKIIKYK